MSVERPSQSSFPPGSDADRLAGQPQSTDSKPRKRYYKPPASSSSHVVDFKSGNAIDIVGTTAKRRSQKIQEPTHKKTAKNTSSVLNPPA